MKRFQVFLTRGTGEYQTTIPQGVPIEAKTAKRAIDKAISYIYGSFKYVVGPDQEGRHPDKVTVFLKDPGYSQLLNTHNYFHAEEAPYDTHQSNR